MTGAPACRVAALAAALALAACATRPPPSLACGEARVTFSVTRLAGRTAYGVAAPSRAFTPDTLVRIASVSKLVTAIGVMRLVEAGTLDLDRDVSDVLGWRLRNPAFPAAPITLRMLLSHTSGLVDQGDDYAVPLGRDLRDAIQPANWSAHPPGTWFHYTNFNFPVVATAMEAATATRFDRLMARLVLAPLHLDACYNWATCSNGAVARAAVLTDGAGTVVKDDLGGFRPACAGVNRVDASRCDLDAYVPGTNGAVFSPQGGLRISMVGLATIGRLLLGNGAVDGVRLLRPDSISVMRTPAWRFDGRNGDSEEGLHCAYGLAEELTGVVPGCRDDLFGGGRPRDGHSGEAFHVRSGLWLDRARGTGVAFVATGVVEPASVAADSAFTAVEHALATDSNRTRRAALPRVMQHRSAASGQPRQTSR